MNTNLNIDNMNTFPNLSFKNIKNIKDKVKSNMLQPILEKISKNSNIKRLACKTILNGEICSYGNKCSFAHSIRDMIVDDCMNGSRCYFVYVNKDGVYMNNGDKICRRKHISETIENFHERVQTKKYNANLHDENPKFSVKCTKMCKTVLQENKCETENCQYAHRIEELILTDCGFKDKCIYVVKKNETFLNIDCKRKVCIRKHPGETPENVVKRRKDEQEVNRPSIHTINFPEGVTTEIKDGTFFIRTPYNSAMVTLSVAMKNNIKNINLTTY